MVRRWVVEPRACRSLALFDISWMPAIAPAKSQVAILILALEICSLTALQLMAARVFAGMHRLPSAVAARERQLQTDSPTAIFREKKTALSQIVGTARCAEACNPVNVKNICRMASKFNIEIPNPKYLTIARIIGQGMFD